MVAHIQISMPNDYIIRVLDYLLKVHVMQAFSFDPCKCTRSHLHASAHTQIYLYQYSLLCLGSSTDTLKMLTQHKLLIPIVDSCQLLTLFMRHL